MTKEEIIFVGKMGFPGELHLEHCQWMEGEELGCLELAEVQLATMEQTNYCFCWKHFLNHLKKLRSCIYD